MNNQADNFDIEALLAELQWSQTPDTKEDSIISLSAPLLPVEAKQKLPELSPALEIPAAPLLPAIPLNSEFTNDIEFDTKFRGYDRHQVDHYIDAITEDYNSICARCDALEKENEGLRQALSQLAANSMQWAFSNEV